MIEMITASSLVKCFGSTRAVDDLSLSIRQGEIYGLVGPDGAGKTTTLRLLCGVMAPNHGEVRIGGVAMAKDTPAAQALIGYLAQRFALYDELTVLENLRFYAEIRGLAVAEWKPRSMEILEFVGLAEFCDRRAVQLSGGMRQKLGLAAALAHRPRVLLLDEPTTGVDPVTRQDFWQLIIRLAQQEGVTVLVSTPYMDEAARCNRLGFMRAGRLMVEGTPLELRARLNERMLLVQGSPLLLLRSIVRQDEGVENIQMFGDRLHVRTRLGDREAVAARLQNSIPAGGGSLTQVRSVSAQLEDVFISLLEAEKA